MDREKRRGRRRRKQAGRQVGRRRFAKRSISERSWQQEEKRRRAVLISQALNNRADAGGRAREAEDVRPHGHGRLSGQATRSDVERRQGTDRRTERKNTAGSF